MLVEMHQLAGVRRAFAIATILAAAVGWSACAARTASGTTAPGAASSPAATRPTAAPVPPQPAPPPAAPAAAPTITEASIRAHLEFLASDALNGRGSGTRDEWLAAMYVASQFRL
jgi:hypothetical protein